MIFIYENYVTKINLNLKSVKYIISMGIFLSYCFKAIGIVEKGFPKPEDPNRNMYKSKHEFIGIIRIFDDYLSGLKGLEEYSHIIVLYVFSEVERSVLEVEHHLTGRQIGIFATRYPPRPNPIGLTVVELINLDPPKLIVKGLDAWTGTPILDLKPYDYYDIIKRPRVSRDFEIEWKRNFETKRDIYEKLTKIIGPC
jgi:tRNA-Thr(GGU) m(6)t(6)A37 methyltransferase TsaA